MRFYLSSMLAGFLLDLCLGDPHSLPHPVRAIGWLIEKGEKGIRKLIPEKPFWELAGGAALVVFVLGATFGASFALLWAGGSLHPVVKWIFSALMCYYLFAVKSLKDESMKVYDALAEQDVEQARKWVSMIVGRDTEPLDGAGIAKAAVETVAENTSDGVIGPMFYMILGGPVLGFLYKAVNTMDSMVGYKNDRYLYFGRIAARLDDIINFIPARLSALFMIGAAALAGYDWRSAARICRRDRYCHKSPNSAHTEAVCAGALHIQLAGNACYFGILHEKPTIGDEGRPVEFEDIKRANRLLYLTSGVALVIMTGIRWGI